MIESRRAQPLKQINQMAHFALLEWTENIAMAAIIRRGFDTLA